MFNFRKSSPAANVASALAGPFTNEEVAKIDQIGTATLLSAGTKFLTEGATGQQVVVILKGTATVEQNGESVATVGAGDFVGETSLLQNAPRNASLIAETPLSVVVFTKQELDHLMIECPRIESVLNELATTRQGSAA